MDAGASVRSIGDQIAGGDDVIVGNTAPMRFGKQRFKGFQVGIGAAEEQYGSGRTDGLGHGQFLEQAAPLGEPEGHKVTAT